MTNQALADASPVRSITHRRAATAADKALKAAGRHRPAPPASVAERSWVNDGTGDLFIPAPDVTAWIFATFLTPGGPLWNADHEHLELAQIGVLWTNIALSHQQRHIVATAEMPMTQGNAWKRGRAQQQLREWFPHFMNGSHAEPDFLITLSAPDLVEAPDRAFCGVIEHELYHCGQLKIDGAPRFHKDGTPMYGILGHDSEEFVGVVRRYGLAASSPGTRALVDAAQRSPELGGDEIAFACGTCAGRIGSSGSSGTRSRAA